MRSPVQIRPSRLIGTPPQWRGFAFPRTQGSRRPIWRLRPAEWTRQAVHTPAAPHRGVPTTAPASPIEQQLRELDRIKRRTFAKVVADHPEADPATVADGLAHPADEHVVDSS